MLYDIIGVIHVFSTFLLKGSQAECSYFFMNAYYEKTLIQTESNLHPNCANGSRHNEFFKKTVQNLQYFLLFLHFYEKRLTKYFSV